MKKTIILIVFLVQTLFLAAQTFVIKESPKNDTIPQEMDSHWDGGFLFDVFTPLMSTRPSNDSEPFTAIYARSLGLRVLPNVKYLFNDEFSAVLHLGYSLNNFGFNTDPSLISFSGADTVGNHKFSFSSITTGLGIRFTDYEKHYTELGVMFHYAAGRNYQYEEKNSQGETIHVKVPAPSYLKKTFGEIYFRYGIEGLGLVVTYRFTDLLKATAQQPQVHQLPAFSIGASLGL